MQNNIDLQEHQGLAVLKTAEIIERNESLKGQREGVLNDCKASLFMAACDYDPSLSSFANWSTGRLTHETRVIVALHTGRNFRRNMDSYGMTANFSGMTRDAQDLALGTVAEAEVGRSMDMTEAVHKIRAVLLPGEFAVLREYMYRSTGRVQYKKHGYNREQVRQMKLRIRRALLKRYGQKAVDEMALLVGIRR